MVTPQTRKFSASENPEGVIGDVAAHSARFMTQHRRSRSFGSGWLFSCLPGTSSRPGFISCAAACSQRHERNRA